MADTVIITYAGPGVVTNLLPLWTDTDPALKGGFTLVLAAKGGTLGFC